jgi:protein transport protein SEC23
VFNNSPDETAFQRVSLYRETVPNMLLMIQPSLLAYSMEEPPQAVLLDISSVNPKRILLLDSFFIVLIFYGEVKTNLTASLSIPLIHVSF